jgi:hypothetical protein
VSTKAPPTAIIFQSHDPHPVPALQDCSIIQSSLFEKEKKSSKDGMPIKTTNTSA